MRCSGVRVDSELNARKLATIRLGNVPSVPRPHQVHSNDKSTGIQLDAKAGQTYFVRVDIKTGAWKGHGQITLIDPQEGKYEFSKQKVSVTRDLSANQATPAADSTKTAAAAQ